MKVAAQIEKEWDLHDYAQTCGSVEQPDGPGAGTDGPVGRGNHIQVRPGDMIFRNATTGHLIRALAPTDRFASDPIDDGEPYPVGRRLAAWMSGDMPSLRAGANQGGVDTQGGYLFEPRLSQEFVDLARRRRFASRPGRTIPMEAAELHIARATSDPIGSLAGKGWPCKRPPGPSTAW